MGNASFLLDELLYSVGPDDGSDQVALVGPGIFLLHCLLPPTGMAELVWSYMTVNTQVNLHSNYTEEEGHSNG